MAHYAFVPRLNVMATGARLLRNQNIIQPAPTRRRALVAVQACHIVFQDMDAVAEDESLLLAHHSRRASAQQQSREDQHCDPRPL